MMRTSAFLFVMVCAAACGNGGGGGGPDGGGGGPGGGPGDGSCSLVGTWHFTVSAPGGPPLASTYEAKSDGSSQLTFGSAAARSGTWAVDHDTIHIVDTSSTSQSCGAGVVGTYHLAFASGCAAVTFTLVDDMCSGRAQVVGGLTMTR